VTWAHDAYHVPVEGVLESSQLSAKKLRATTKPEGSVHRYPQVSHLELMSTLQSLEVYRITGSRKSEKAAFRCYECEDRGA